MLEGRSIRVALDDVALAQIFNFPFRSGVWSIGGTIEVESPIGLWVAVEGFAAPDGQTIAFPREARSMPPIYLIPWSLIRAARLGLTPDKEPTPIGFLPPEIQAEISKRAGDKGTISLEERASVRRTCAQCGGEVVGRGDGSFYCPRCEPTKGPAQR